MCEWLSYGDWCDVQLLCGGRAFSAHRVVLASVSTFLRRLLLSCPIDESPTFIVLPEFDFDAMSAVLYYIYNGEVIIQRQKLEMFLDIIKAMQIFIDNQYLPQDSDERYHVNLECRLETDFYKNNIFTLKFENSQDKTFVNLKKGGKVPEVGSKYSVSDSVCNKDLVRNQNPSEDVKCSLANLKSTYQDRQKNSFLRDIFLETYPRNGNVNGLRASVLAISNECYRAPASVLLTNANGNHLSADNILLESYEKTSKLISDSPTVLQLQRRCTQSEPDYGECSKKFCDLSFKNIIGTEKMKSKYVWDTSIQNTPKNDWMSRIPIPPNEFVQLGVQERFLSGLYVPSVDYSMSPRIFNTVKSMQAYRTIPVCSALSNNENKQSWNEMDKISTSKTTILNHVLDSPWCPRMPNSFKPFRRKTENSLSQVTVKKEITNISDSNNNVNRPCLSTDTVNHKEVTSTKTKNTVNVLQDDSDILHFKCTHCNQVFISRDLLTVHMRRHSTNARYTCGECDKTFSQLRNFKYHMSIHRGTREFAATCTVCGKYFNDRGYLSSHMKIHRNRKEYKCTLCPKSFNQRVAYNMHVRIHTGVKPHVCEQCGKAFSRKMLLKQHQRTHSGERPYACPHCDKRFADRSNMTLHLRLHTGIKPFSCTLCPKSFTKKHHLKSHLNFHTGSKPYSCPRCKLAFTQSSNMRTHLKKCRAPEPIPNTETS